MSNAGSTLIEYALIAALVSIVILTVGRGLGFPEAAAIALAKVASAPQEAGSPGLDSESQAYPRGGRSFAGEASGSGFLPGTGTNSVFPMPGAGASGSAEGTWIDLTAIPSPIPGDSDPSDSTRFDIDAATIAPVPRIDGPIWTASPPEPDEKIEGSRDRRSGGRSTGAGSAAGDRRPSAGKPARRSERGAERLAALNPGDEAEVLTAERASLAETAGTAGAAGTTKGQMTQDTPARSRSGLNRGSAWPAEDRNTLAKRPLHMGDRRLWALVVLVLASLGFGAQRLRRRLSGATSGLLPGQRPPDSAGTR